MRELRSCINTLAQQTVMEHSSGSPGAPCANVSEHRSGVVLRSDAVGEFGRATVTGRLGHTALDRGSEHFGGQVLEWQRLGQLLAGTTNDPRPSAAARRSVTAHWIRSVCGCSGELGQT